MSSAVKCNDYVSAWAEAQSSPSDKQRDLIFGEKVVKSVQLPLKLHLPFGYP